jgi:hypothetical protein
MASQQASTDADRHRVHIIEGTWTTKALHIDGSLLTVDRILERLHREGFYGRCAQVQTFVWGPDAPPETVRIMAYGCCAWTVPASWIRNRAVHMALEAFFLHKILRLRPADFALRYTEQALQNAMRRMQRWWCKQLQKPQHTLRL